MFFPVFLLQLWKRVGKLWVRSRDYGFRIDICKVMEFYKLCRHLDTH